MVFAEIRALEHEADCMIWLLLVTAQEEPTTESWAD